MLEQAVTIIIVSYNSFETLQRCLGNWLYSPSCKTIVVDNASTDGSAEKISHHYPAVTLLSENINLGYGRAANRALQEVTTPYALLLNPDIIATEDHVAALVERAQILGNNLAFLAPAVQKKDYTRSGVEQRQWIIGAAMLFNMKVFSEVGFFDENIFLFSEESDLCRRVIKHGFNIYLDTNIFIEHLYRQSSTPSRETERLKNWHMGWSNAYYRRKYGLDTGRKSPLRVATLYFIKSLIATTSQKRLAYRARLAGTLAFLRGKSAFLPDGQPQQLPHS